MKIFNCLICFSTIILTISCNKEESVQNSSNNTAVVEGYLFGGQPLENIKVFQSFSYNQLDTVLITLDDLEITVADLTDQYPLFHIGNGIYQNPDVIVAHDQTYSISFIWNGASISAQTYIPTKREANISMTEVALLKIELGERGGFGSGSDPVEITWENETGDYYYIVIENIEEHPEYVNENIALFQAQNGGQSRFEFISEPEVINFYAIDARRELSQFGTHRIVVFRVNPEYASLYESSGNTTLSLEEPPSNINNGLGIFTGVSSDTLYLEVIKQ